MPRHGLLAEVVAEFLGTLVLLAFGGGVVAMVVLFGSGVPGEVVSGGWTNITLGWGLAVTFGVYLSIRISGGHLNPAVTLALAVFRGFPWRKVIPYCLAQVAGAFAGSALVFFNYREAIARFDPGLEKTAGIFTTFPAFPDVPAAGFFDQVIGTALLLLLIFAIGDERNLPPQANLAPLVVGLIVVAIGVSFGKLHGYAINPARDFGPRLLTVLVGYKNNGLTAGSSVWWVPIAGPLAGGLIGAGMWDLVLRRMLPDK
ncbi:MAG: MIP/aquaporin family protein [Bryobacteraceae bacterium]|jgi:glycerol uptake facilitator protein